MGAPLPSLPPSSLSSASDGRHHWRDGLACRRFVVVRRFCNIRSLRQQMFNFSHSWSQSPYQYRDAPFNDRLPSSFLSCHHVLSFRRSARSPVSSSVFHLSRARGGDRMVDISAPARSTRSQHVCVQYVCLFTVLMEIHELVGHVGGTKMIERIFIVRHSIH